MFDLEKKKGILRCDVCGRPGKVYEINNITIWLGEGYPHNAKCCESCVRIGCRYSHPGIGFHTAHAFYMTILRECPHKSTVTYLRHLPHGELYDDRAKIEYVKHDHLCPTFHEWRGKEYRIMRDGTKYGLPPHWNEEERKKLIKPEHLESVFVPEKVDIHSFREFKRGKVFKSHHPSSKQELVMLVGKNRYGEWIGIDYERKVNISAIKIQKWWWWELELRPRFGPPKPPEKIASRKEWYRTIKYRRKERCIACGGGECRFCDSYRVDVRWCFVCDAPRDGPATEGCPGCWGV